MREAMMDYLYNDDTGAFVLNYDQDGNYQDNFTADEIFPVLFGICRSTQRRAILARLQEADFVTPVGLRTISTADAWYFPSYGFGLLGGIWPDLTLWCSVALARNGMTDEAVHFLNISYAAMEGGSPRNTVPGEFAEWFDGGSLSNRGMYLSPWTGAKYLWAVAETVGGLNGYRTSGRPHLAPLRPKGLAVGCRGARALGRPALHVRRRSAQRYDLRRHARAFGGGAVQVHLRRPRRERRGHDVARRSRRDRI